MKKMVATLALLVLLGSGLKTMLDEPDQTHTVAVTIPSYTQVSDFFTSVGETLTGIGETLSDIAEKLGIRPEKVPDEQGVP